VEQDKPDYWFAVKRYGWGWGMPVRWQGWAALALYFVSIIADPLLPATERRCGLFWFTLSSVILAAMSSGKATRLGRLAMGQ
jgi:hypothetical protein